MSTGKLGQGGPPPGVCVPFFLHLRLGSLLLGVTSTWEISDLVEMKLSYLVVHKGFFLFFGTSDWGHQ